ncbi:MAG: hypothetical protein V4738_13610 [Pseudomonadota bacterium]
MLTNTPPAIQLAALTVLLALSACGGGGGDAPAAALPAVSAPVAPAGNAVRGRAIYQTICINCHAPNPEDDRRGVRRASASGILFAVQAVNQMRFLRDTIGPQEAADLEIWLANPV